MHLEAVNSSDEFVQVGVGRLLDGATFEEFVAYHQPEPTVTEPPDFVDVATLVRAQPGTTDGFTCPLERGEYGLVCLVGDAEGAWVAQPGGVTVTG